MVPKAASIFSIVIFNLNYLLWRKHIHNSLLYYLWLQPRLFWFCYQAGVLVNLV